MQEISPHLMEADVRYRSKKGSPLPLVFNRMNPVYVSKSVTIVRAFDSITAAVPTLSLHITIFK